MTEKVLNFLMLYVVMVTFGGVSEAATYLAEKPAFLTPCRRDDPGFEKCFSSNFDALFREYKDGIPGSKAVKSLDPLPVKRVTIAQDGKGPVSLNAELTNILISGGSKTQTKKADWREKEETLNLLFFAPQLKVQSDYKVDGRILSLPLNGHGKLNFVVDKIAMAIKIKYKLRKEHGFTFSDVVEFHLDIKEIGGFNIKLENLFNGQKDLEDAANMTFNENWRDLYEALKPAIRQACEALLANRVKAVFKFIPASYFIENL
uniref:Protein takeout n=1 Tax=Glossina pallidipes TaxID=7398 RepID=A0A1A9ZSQ6_GLOPL